jgi:hypothetical protein
MTILNKNCKTTLKKKINNCNFFMQKMSSMKEQTYLQQNKEGKSYFNKFVKTWIFS